MEDQLHDIYALLDSDESGAITADEVRHFNDSLGDAKLTDADVLAVFAECDTDGSSEVEADEFVALTSRIIELTGLSLDAAMALFKQHCYRQLFTSLVQEDADGVLFGDLRKLIETLAERLGQNITSEDLRKLFDEYDNDDSGHIDGREFQQILVAVVGEEVQVSTVVREFEASREQALQRMSTMRSLFGRRRGDTLLAPASPKSIKTDDIGEEEGVEDAGDGDAGSAAGSAVGSRSPSSRRSGSAGGTLSRAASRRSQPTNPSSRGDGGGGGGGGGDSLINPDSRARSMRSVRSAATLASHKSGSKRSGSAGGGSVPVHSAAGSLANPDSHPAPAAPEPSEPDDAEPTPYAAAAPFAMRSPPAFPDLGGVPHPEMSFDTSPGGGYTARHSDTDDDDDDGGVDFGLGHATADTDDGADSGVVDLDELSTHERLYYAGCGAEMKKQAYLRRERDLKIMNELATMSSPKITAMGKAAPSRSDEFRSHGVQVIYEKRLEHQRAMNAMKERRAEEATPAYRMTESSQRILEQPRKKYHSPVTDWHKHNDKYLLRNMEKPLDHSFTPNINRSSHASATRHGGQQPVFARLHHDSMKNPKYNPSLAKELAERDAAMMRRSASPNRSQRRGGGEPMRTREQGGIVFTRSPQQSIATASMSPASAPRGGYSSSAAVDRFATLSLPPSSSQNDTVVSRLLSAGQEKHRRRVAATEKADTEVKSRHPFKPALNQRSLDLAESRKQKKLPVDTDTPGYMVSTPQRARAQLAKERELQHQQQHQPVRRASSAAAGTPGRGGTPGRFSHGPGQQHPPREGKWVVEEFIARANQRADRRREREQKMQAEREQKEMEGCTFQPKLCRNSEMMFYDRGQPGVVFEEEYVPENPWGSPAVLRTSPPRMTPHRTASPRTTSPHRMPTASVGEYRPSPVRSVSPAAVPPPGAVGSGLAGLDPPPISHMAAVARHYPREVSPFNRAAPSKDVTLSTHSIEREIDAVLNEWNKIQAL